MPTLQTMKTSRLILLFVLLLCPIRAEAQAIRYELGQRTRTCEIAWDAQPDAAARKRATAFLKQAVTLFFSFKLNEAARALDQARFALHSETPPAPETQWAESLYFTPESRLIDKSATQLSGTIAELYSVTKENPASATISLTLQSQQAKGKGKPFEFAVTSLPLQITLPLNSARLSEGDYTLWTQLRVAGRTLTTTSRTISIVAGLTARLAALKLVVAGFTTTSTEIETAKSLTALLDSLAQKQTLETNYPAARLLNEAEAVVKAINAGRSFYGNQKTGQFWLTLATAKGALVTRINAPEAVKTGKPLPLVIALHGAGGSENMFFDTYGHGEIVRLSEQHGWLLVSPRGMGMNPDRVPALLDEIARLYPVDRQRVFIVGHSMGAAQTVAVSQLAPEKFAAVAALGGGGAIKTVTDQFRALPFYIGIGTEDFALRNAKGLKDSLEKAEVRKVQYREYLDIEHLFIVQVALKDVFAFFESAAGSR